MIKRITIAVVFLSLILLALLAAGCDRATYGPVNTDPIRPAMQAANDVKNGNAVIYYSGPHSGYDVPTPVLLPESDWGLVKDLPRNYRGEVMASVPFDAAGRYNEAVIKALKDNAEQLDAANSNSATAPSD